MPDRKEESPNPVRLCRAAAGITDCLRDLWRRSGQAEQDVLTVSQRRMVSAVLRLTEKRPGGVTLSELSAHLALSGSAASVMVDSLVRRKWLLRRTGEKDRRMVRICLSGQGRARMKQEEAFFRKKQEVFWESVPEEQQARAVELLEGFLNSLAEENPAGKNK